MRFSSHVLPKYENTVFQFIPTHVLYCQYQCWYQARKHPQNTEYLLKNHKGPVDTGNAVLCSLVKNDFFPHGIFPYFSQGLHRPKSPISWELLQQKITDKDSFSCRQEAIWNFLCLSDSKTRETRNFMVLLFLNTMERSENCRGADITWEERHFSYPADGQREALFICSFVNYCVGVKFMNSTVVWRPIPMSGGKEFVDIHYTATSA